MEAMNGDCLRHVARWLCTPDVVSLASTCRHFRHELSSLPRAAFGYRRRGGGRLERTSFVDVAAWARSRAASGVRHLAMCRVLAMTPTMRTVIAAQASFRALHGLRTLRMNMCRVPPEFLALLPRGLRVLVVHRVSGFVALTAENLGRLRQLEHASIAARGVVSVQDHARPPALRHLRLSSDASIDWDAGGGDWDGLDALALHAPRVCLRRPPCRARCMSISAVQLLFGPSGSTRATHTGLLHPGWASGLQHLRILVDSVFDLDDIPYRDMDNLQSMEFACDCPVIPFELSLLPRLRRVVIESDTLVVFEDRMLERGERGYADLPSRIAWTFGKLTTWKSRRCCQDLCWAPPPPR